MSTYLALAATMDDVSAKDMCRACRQLLHAQWCKVTLHVSGTILFNLYHKAHHFLPLSADRTDPWRGFRTARDHTAGMWSHQESNQAARLLSLFLPCCPAWVALGPWLSPITYSWNHHHYKPHGITQGIKTLKGTPYPTQPFCRKS